jgi:hypothetical protein
MTAQLELVSQHAELWLGKDRAAGILCWNVECGLEVERVQEFRGAKIARMSIVCADRQIAIRRDGPSSVLDSLSHVEIPNERWLGLLKALLS